MTAVTDDLVAFIRARLAEVEKRLQWALDLGDGDEIDRHSLPGHSREVARAIHSQARNRLSPISDIQVRHLLAIGFAAGAERGEDYGAHVLRGIEAKRRILDEHAPTPTGTGFAGDFHCSTCVSPGNIANDYPDDWSPQRHPCTTVRLLASEHADHPDYRQEWTV